MERGRWFWQVLKWPVMITLLIAVVTSLLLTHPWSGNTSYSPPPLETKPVTTLVDGQRVFVIHPAPRCPPNANCSANVVINKQLWPFTPYPSPPKPLYRNGPLYAVGPDEEAHLIPGVSTDSYQVVALRIGQDWYLAWSPNLPRDTEMRRRLCPLYEAPADSQCEAQLGEATVSPISGTASDSDAAGYRPT